MRTKLDPCWTKRLLELPESGMGYQRVDVRLRRTGAPGSAEEIEVPGEFAAAKITDVRLHAT